MGQLYVVGGRQRPGVDSDIDEWHHYGTAVVASVDVDTGEVTPRVEYVTPPDACAAGEDPSIVFKTATIEGSRLYVPTQTEVLIYELPTFRRIGYISQPAFNDVHHVRPGAAGTVLIANTGLDMVMELSLDGTVKREWSSFGEELWTRFSRDVDYRKVVSTKPHRSHPNNVWLLDGEIWVTRCDTKDAFCLTADLPPVAIADRWIHDGLVYGDAIYFTSVNGGVIIVDAETRSVRRSIDLNAMVGNGTPLGWCRGIELLDDDIAAVGFSRLRPTKWKEKVRWAKHRLGGDGMGLQPTRIALIDLRNDRLIREIDLEPGGMNVVFSVHRSD